MKSTYQLSYYMRILLTVVVYILFYAYIIYSCINANNIVSIILFILIGLIFGGIGTLFELLRIWYDKATKKIIFEGKPEETLRLLDRIDRFDILKSFRTSTQMMRMLAMIDLRRFKELLEYSKNLENSDYDVEIVRKYCEMMAHGEMGNKGKSNEAFKQLTGIRDQKDKKGRRYKGAYYFNWEVVNGQHKNYDRDYDAAYRYLKDVDEAKMNNRELMHYLSARVLAARNTGHLDEYKQLKERLIRSCKDNTAMKDYSESL